MPTNPLNKWTPAQKEAIDSIDRSMLVLAGAGSGKTEVLTHRILKILQKNKNDLSQILAITFTERAAMEMKERLYPLLHPQAQRGLAASAIGTFHGIFGQILLEQGPLVTLSPETTVLNPYATQLLIHQTARRTVLAALDEAFPPAVMLVGELDFQNVVSLLTECLHFRWHAEQHLFCHPNDELLSALAALYTRANLCWTEYKMRQHRIDFQDLEIKTLELLQKHPALRQQLVRRWKHILIDEMQDTNDLQHQIVSLLFDPQENHLFMVGDPKQSIYRFRGANVTGFLKMAEKLQKNGAAVQLADNFRSRPTLLHFINQAFDKLGGPIPFLALNSRREDNQTTTVECFLSSATSAEDLRKEEAKNIVKVIEREMQEHQRSAGDFVVLFQSLVDVHFYEQALREGGIPYRIFGSRRFLSAQEIHDLLFCLKLAINPNDRMALVGLMRSPLVGMSDEEIITFLEGGKATPPLITFLIHETAKLSPLEILEEVLRRTHYDWFVSQLDPSGTKLANIEQFLAMAREATLEQFQSVDAFVTFIEDLKREGTPISGMNAIDGTTGAVQIMSVHAAKGLEFPVVLLPDLFRALPNHSQPYYFVRGAGFGFKRRPKEKPFADRVETEEFLLRKKEDKEAELEEKKRLLYVAMTRAKEKLILFLPPEKKRGGPWLAWVRQAVERAGIPIKAMDERSFDSAQDERRMAQEPEMVEPIQEQYRDEWRHVSVTDLSENAGDADNHPPPSPSPRGRGLGGGGGLRLGNLVHTVLKKYRPGVSLTPLIQQAAFQLHWQQTPEEETEIHTLLQNFLQSDIVPKGWGKFQEVPFQMKLPEQKMIVTGAIDFIEETSKGTIIYDFKTDIEVRPEKYRRQMELYALALSQATSKPVLATHLLYLRSLKVIITSAIGGVP